MMRKHIYASLEYKAMKLHLMIDSKIISKLNCGDVVLLSAYNNIELPSFVEKVIIDMAIINESKEIYNEINAFFKGNDPVFLPVRNTIYVKFFRPIYTVLAYIDLILKKYHIEQIVLYEGSTFSFFIINGGEGEGTRSFYKTNWLVNETIYNKYHDIYSLDWVSRKSSVLFMIFNYYIYMKEIAHFIGSAIKQNIRYYHCHCRVPLSNNSLNIISVVDLPLQYRHLKSFLSSIPNINWQVLTLSNNLPNINEENLHFIEPLPLLSMLSILNKSYVFNDNSLLTNLGVNRSFFSQFSNLLVKELTIRMKRLCGSLKNLPNDNSVLVTNTTVGIDMVSSHLAAKLNSLKHVNFQYVAMAKILYPDLELADKYYLYSNKTYQLYKQISDCYGLYLPILKKESNMKGSSEDLTYTIFTQPDSYTQIYIDYLEVILPLLYKSNRHVNVIVKPHYRQDRMKDITTIVNSFSFAKVAGIHDDCGSLLEMTDICMSIDSSVIFEALTHQTLCIVYNPMHRYEDSIYNNDVCYPEINPVIINPEDTLSILDNIENETEDYLARYDNYRKDHNMDSNIASLLYPKN